MISIFIPIILSLSLLSSDSPKNTGKLHDKAVLYNFLEYFIGLDQLVQGDEDSLFRISHCSIIEEEKTEPLKTYDGIGSCLNEQMLFLSEEENEKISIKIHAFFQEKPIIFFLKWDVLKIKSVFNSYLEKTPKHFDTSIRLYNADNIELIKPTLIDLKEKIHEIRIDLQTQDDVMDIEIKILNKSQDVLYRYNIITNYYIKAESFFFKSGDVSKNEKGDLS